MSKIKETIRQLFMSKYFTLSILFLSMIFLSNSLKADFYESTSKQELNGKWEYRVVSANSEWLPASVPGCVHTDLMTNGVIEDPFFRVNEKNLQWIGEKDWEYKTQVDITKDLLQKENVNLVFKGLDTYASVYLNEKLILKADNMHREWTVDIKPFIKEGINELRIYFSSVYKVNMPKYLDAPFLLSAWDNNDQCSIWLSLYSRKAGFHFGWDWGSRLLTAGVWRPVFIESWNDTRIKDIQIIQNEVGPKMAKLTAKYEIESDKETTAFLQIKNGNKSWASKQVKLNAGLNIVPIDFNVKNPKLWWTNGLGEAYLYDIECTLETQKVKDTKTITTGIRSLNVITKKDEHGKSMFVELNGVPVFMKGANYIPLHNFQNLVSKEKYEYYIKVAVESNMNMLRVWGGGIYEEDYFYELCDKNGILVWQDIMFACGMFPVDEEFTNTVEQEVIDNVKRLRNHACIALWNGNNENEISWYHWGWKDRYTKEQQTSYEANMKKLFYDVIPNAISKADKTRYYHPTSPNTGYNDIPFSYGDVHYWDTKGDASLETYNHQVGRFMSEYGFQSYPELNSIKKFTHKNDRFKNSEVMFAHNRARHDQTRDPNFGNNAIERKMKQYYNIPEEFESYVYTTQILHAKASKIAIESHRRHMPYCMGTLYWQLNDCWPAVSWSTTDYYGTWKAAQYMVREVNKTIAISVIEKDKELDVYVISDSLSNVKTELQLMLKTLNGEVKKKWVEDVQIEANNSKVYFKKDVGELLGDIDKKNCVLEISLLHKNAVIDSELYYFVPEKELALQAPNIKKSYKNEGDKLTITLSTNTLARNVYLTYPDKDGHFSDNYFDLMPGVTKTILFTPSSNEQDSLGLPKVRSLFDFN